MTNNTPQDNEVQPQKPAKLVKHSGSDKAGVAKAADVFKLLVALFLIAAGVWAFYNVQGYPDYIRALFPLLGVVAGLVIIFFWCDFGRRLVRYVRDSVAEFKKVVWPPRNDAVRMTLFVIAFVAVLSVFIYAVDTLISWLFFDVLLKRG